MLSFLINTVAQRAVAEPENTDDQQTWPSCFVEKGYQRVTLSNDQATLSQRRLTISFRPRGAQTRRELVVVSPRPLSEGGGELRCPSGYRSPIGIF